MAFNIGDLVFHLTADKPFSIIYKVANKTSESSYTLLSSRKMPGGVYSLFYVIPEDMQLVNNRKKEQMNQFSPPGEKNADGKFKLGDFVYILNDSNPYALCYQLIQAFENDSFNAICSSRTRGGAHVLYNCYIEDMQMISDKKVSLIRNHFLPVSVNVEEDSDDDMIDTSVAKLLSILGYPSYPVYHESLHEDTPVPPRSVFEILEIDMTR